MHGYNGKPVGNNFALARHIVSNDIDTEALTWTGKGDSPPELASINFQPVPDRHAPFSAHLAYLFFLLKFKIISLESAGDLSFYLRFIPPKKRLIVLLPHGFCLKSCGVLAPNLSAEQRRLWAGVGGRFNLISAASQLEAYMISATMSCPIGNVPVLGQQRHTAEGVWTQNRKDEALALVEELYGSCTTSNRLIVYAPTHRDHQIGDARPVPFGFQSLEALNRALEQSRTRLLIREHALGAPQNVGDWSHIDHSSMGPDVDFNLLAPATDILITDYSGIFIDFLNSDMRLAFWQYDIENYRKARGFSLPEDIFSVGKRIGNDGDFRQLLDDATHPRDEQTAKRHWHALLNENVNSVSLVKTIDEIKARAERIK